MSSVGKFRVLDQWAELYADLAIELEQHCAGLAAHELDDLESSARMPTETNCWWAVYQVAPIVLCAVAGERRRRNRKIA